MPAGTMRTVPYLDMSLGTDTGNPAPSFVYSLQKDLEKIKFEWDWCRRGKIKNQYPSKGEKSIKKLNFKNIQEINGIEKPSMAIALLHPQKREVKSKQPFSIEENCFAF